MLLAFIATARRSMWGTAGVGKCGVLCARGGEGHELAGPVGDGGDGGDGGTGQQLTCARLIYGTPDGLQSIL